MSTSTWPKSSSSAASAAGDGVSDFRSFVAANVFKGRSFVSDEIYTFRDWDRMRACFSKTPDVQTSGVIAVGSAGNVRMSANATTDSVVRPVYASNGRGGGSVVLSTFGFPWFTNPCSQPWALETLCMFNPGNVATVGGLGTIYVCGLSGSSGDSSATFGAAGNASPGVGSNGGAIALAYANGQLLVRKRDAFGINIDLAAPAFTIDNRAHRMMLYFDGLNITTRIDGVVTTISPLMHEAPQAAAFPFLGIEAGGANDSTGNFGLEWSEFRWALPAYQA